MGERGERLQREAAGVERDGGRVRVQDEAVVEGGGGGGEGEGLVGRGEGGVRGDGAEGDAGGGEGEVLGCAKGDDCAVDGGGGGVKVEVAGGRWSPSQLCECLVWVLVLIGGAGKRRRTCGL